MHIWIILFLLTNLQGHNGQPAIEQGYIRDSNGVDVYPVAFNPVPFGTVYNPGVVQSDRFANKGHDDPSLDINKSIVNPLQLNKRIPKYPEYEEKLTASTNIRQNLGKYESERYKFNQRELASDKFRNDSDVTKKKPMWFHFAKQHEENIKPKNTRRTWLAETKPKFTDRRRQKGANRDSSHLETLHDFSSVFVPGTFTLKSELESPDGNNWTTCDDFAVGAAFHPQDIVDIKWVPFFIWSRNTAFKIALVHTFAVPTINVVQSYKEKYGPFLSEDIKWEEPKLFLTEGNAGREILLIAADRRGLFYAVPNHQIPSSIKGNKKIKLPTLTVRLKIEDPYLVMMYCDDDNYYATIMAEDGKEPATVQDKVTEAESIKFKGLGIPVSRCLEEEKILAEAIKKRKQEEEQRKFIEVNEDPRKHRTRDWE